MKSYVPTSTWVCRKCGKKVPYNVIVFVGNGVPLCQECAKSYKKTKKGEKP